VEATIVLDGVMVFGDRWQIFRVSLLHVCRCISQVTPAFLQQMEAILELYQRPYNPKRPLVCFDEKSAQLLAHIVAMRLAEPGRAARQDYEYKREGASNLFLFVEPKAGFRHVLATNRRTKQDFAFAIRYLVDVLYPEADCIIDVVLDNLNTHHYRSRGVLRQTRGRSNYEPLVLSLPARTCLVVEHGRD